MRYNKVVYRFTAKSSTTTYEKYQTFGSFDPLYRYWIISCKNGDTDNQQCLEMYELALQTQVSFTLDIIFFRDSEFLLIQKTALAQMPSCFTSVTFEKRSKTELCFQAVWSESDAACNFIFETNEGRDSQVFVMVMYAKNSDMNDFMLTRTSNS